MNVSVFAGNIGKDCRINTVQTANGDVAVCNFTLAVRKRKKNHDGTPQTLWVDCALWGNRVNALSPYLKQGQKVTVSGEVDVDSYQKDGQIVPKLTLNVSDLDLQGGNQQQGHSQQSQGNQQPMQQPAMNQQQPNPRQQNQGGGFDDSIPFAPVGKKYSGLVNAL